MLVPEELVVHVLTVVFSLAAGLVLVLSQEGLLLVDKRIEGLQAVSGVFVKFFLQKVLFLGQHVFNSRIVHPQPTKYLPALISSQLIVEFTILVEEQARHVLVLEVLDALGSHNFHKLPGGMLLRYLLQDFSQYSTLFYAVKMKGETKGSHLLVLVH